MATQTLVYTGELTVLTCWCGTRHAVPAELRRYQMRMHEDGREVPNIYCPLGHTHVPAGKGEAEKLRERLKCEREQSARLAAARDQAEASLRAQKGVATKLRKRVAAGVCPCCNRTFQNLSRHMSGQHPEFAEAETV